MKTSKNFSVIFVTLALFLLSSCVETVVVGSVAGAVVVTREKSLKDTATDVKIAALVNSELLKNGLKTPESYVEVMVNEGRVLLLGSLSDPVKAKTASIVTWKISGVKEVIDELELVEEKKVNFKTVGRNIGDYFVTAQIETRLFFTKNVLSRNYKVATVNGVVYLLGVAQDESEMQKVFSAVSRARGVKKVVNHVILVNDRRRQ